MTYSIVKFDRENNQYISQVVNKNPALKEAIKSITTLYCFVNKVQNNKSSLKF